MRAEEKNMVERIMNTETMGYAYEYPYGGGARKEYMLALTTSVYFRYRLYQSDTWFL